jgi:hypothetical protein
LAAQHLFEKFSANRDPERLLSNERLACFVSIVITIDYLEECDAIGQVNYLERLFNLEETNNAMTWDLERIYATLAIFYPYRVEWSWSDNDVVIVSRSLGRF